MNLYDISGPSPTSTQPLSDIVTEVLNNPPPAMSKPDQQGKKRPRTEAGTISPVPNCQPDATRRQRGTKGGTISPTAMCQRYQKRSQRQKRALIPSAASVSFFFIENIILLTNVIY